MFILLCIAEIYIPTTAVCTAVKCTEGHESDVASSLVLSSMVFGPNLKLRPRSFRPNLFNLLGDTANSTARDCWEERSVGNWVGYVRWHCLALVERYYCTE